jgi:hypothetical protein
MQTTLSRIGGIAGISAGLVAVVIAAMALSLGPEPAPAVMKALTPVIVLVIIALIGLSTRLQLRTSRATPLGFSFALIALVAMTADYTGLFWYGVDHRAGLSLMGTTNGFYTVGTFVLGYWLLRHRVGQKWAAVILMLHGVFTTAADLTVGLNLGFTLVPIASAAIIGMSWLIVGAAMLTQPAPRVAAPGSGWWG